MDESPAPNRSKTVFWTLAPLVVLGLLVALFVVKGDRITQPIRAGVENLPAPERIAFERIVFKPTQIVAHVRNAGPTPITITGVHVNDMATRAYLTPSAEIGRLGKAIVTIPHDWVEGDPYEVRLVSAAGLFHSRMVDVAALTPVPGPRYFGVFALLGVLVGVVPVFLGLAWFPALRRAGTGVTQFLLAFTVGLLLFLGVDALEESLEIGENVAAPLQPIMITLIAALGTFFFITIASNKLKVPDSSGGMALGAGALAMMIAFGIGVHNFGEGLAIGAAYALGEATLGGLLVLGFTIHNTTEGIAIVTPLARSGARLRQLIVMGFVAGLPTIVGAWIGGFAYSPLMSLIFLGVGAGAVFQVVYAIMQSYHRPAETLVKPVFAAGIVAGFVLMYATGLLIPS